MKLTSPFTRMLVIALAAALLVPAVPGIGQAPDLILHHGQIVTVDAEFSLAEAMAIRGSHLVKVGGNAEVLALRGEETEVTDLKGRMILPGLIDSHTHPGGASMFEFDHPVPTMETIEDVLDYIKSRALLVEPGRWIILQQVFITRLAEKRYPTKAELDTAAPRHPVMFRTGPDASLNSAALQQFKIDRDTAVPEGSKIEKDSEGHPTGIVRNWSSFLSIPQSGRAPTEPDRENQLLALLKDYTTVGLTTVADRAADDSAVERYARLKDRNELPLRVAVSRHVPTQGSLEEAVAVMDRVAAHPLCQGDAMLRIVGIKIFLDGGMLTGSAYMREPWGVSDIYSIEDPNYRGLRFVGQAKLEALVRAATARGLQFTAHSVGDGAVHALIDAYESVSRDVELRPLRPCITHCNFMSLEAIEKMARLGIGADIQPAWLWLDAATLHRQFGEERLRWFQPLRTLFERGVTVGGGTDHMQKIGANRAVNPYNPWLGIWVTLTRQARGFKGRLHPEQSLSREQAIRFYTINNARLLFLDRQVGSLESGKLADFIVIDRNILTCPVDEIRATRVLGTYVSGQPVYRANDRL